MTVAATNLSTLEQILAILGNSQWEQVRLANQQYHLKVAREGFAGWLVSLAKFDILAEDAKAKANYEKAQQREFRHLRSVHTSPTARLPSFSYARFLIVADSVNQARQENDRHYGHKDLRPVVIAAAAAGEYNISEALVLEYADQLWHDAKNFYAARVSERIDLFLVDPVTLLTLDLSLDEEFQGRVIANAGEKQVILKTSMKTNYRYGENSANGSMTVYRQVPTILESAQGFDPAARIHEAEAAAAAAKGDRKQAIADAQAVVAKAEKTKQAWDSLCNDLRSIEQYGYTHLDKDIAALVAKLGIPAVPTLPAARASYKEAIAAHRAAKANLIAVKEAK